MSKPPPPARFLRSPRWLAGHALVLVTVVLFANLGLWQLDRLEQRRSYNALLTERMAAPPLDLADVADADPERIAYRRVVATGRYEPEGEVLLSTRSHGGRPGHHVLTPMRAGEAVVVVDRGWVPLEHDRPPVAEAAPPEGPVRVEGLLFPSMPARRSGAFDGGSGPTQFVSDVDLDVLEEAAGTPLLPLWVLAADQRPAQTGALPLAADPPALTEGSHLSYAVQWFLFALVVVIGYPLLLRRTYRDERASSDHPSASAPRPPVPAA